MKQPHFKHKNSQKLKIENFLVRHNQKWVWLI